MGMNFECYIFALLGVAFGVCVGATVVFCKLMKKWGKCNREILKHLGQKDL